MTIKINRRKIHDTTYQHYDVTFFETTISTIVTTESSTVDSWISDTQQQHLNLQSAVVGLDVEWLPNRVRNQENPIAVIQLCVGQRCLIFQILHSPIIPYSLLNFLANPFYTFTGVGIAEDVEKLKRHYYLTVARTADLRTLAVDVFGSRKFKNSGLKQLAQKVLRKGVSKPKRVAMSCWDDRRLTYPQVRYACVDAFLSFEIGRILILGS